MFRCVTESESGNTDNADSDHSASML